MTLLCLNVANTDTVLGVFEGEHLLGHWRVASDERQTADEWFLLLDGLVRSADLAPVRAISMCCTVPVILHEMRELTARYFADCPVTIVGPGVKTGIPTLTDNPREVGTDRIVNAVAANALFGGPSIVVDFGTATTFDVVDAEGRYVGGSIAPGIAISLQALGQHGAQLRVVELAAPRGVIAKNTVEALQSGMVYGFAGQVDGIVARMVEALGCIPGQVPVIATGPLADVVVDECRTVGHHLRWLTLTGLRLVHEKNCP
ncbi:MAG: type III pantothenate kinase [Nocardioidaceae bacterium]